MHDQVGSERRQFLYVMQQNSQNDPGNAELQLFQFADRVYKEKTAAEIVDAREALERRLAEANQK